MHNHELLALAQDLSTHQAELKEALRKVHFYPPPFATLGKEGAAIKLLTRLFTALLQAGGNEEQVLELLTPAGDDFFAQVMKLYSPAQEIEVDLPQGITLEQLYAKGQYERYYWDTTPKLSDFRVHPGPEKVRLLLVRPFRYGGECEQSPGLGTCLMRRNLKPARIEHLLAVGAQHPAIAKGHMMLALGSKILKKDSDGYEEWVTPYTSPSSFEKKVQFGFMRPGFYPKGAFSVADMILLALKDAE